MSDIAISDNLGRSWQRWVTRRNVTLLIAGLLLLLLILFGWHVYDVRHARSDAVAEAIKSSDAAFAAGNYGVALAALQSAPAHTKNKAQLEEVYQRLAQAAASDGKVADALNYYALRHKLAAGTAKEDAYIVGQLYEQQGNTAQALVQYRLALAYYQSQVNTEGVSPTTEIQDKIHALEGK